MSDFLFMDSPPPPDTVGMKAFRFSSRNDIFRLNALLSSINEPDCLLELVNGFNCLHIAAKKGYEQVVQSLLSKCSALFESRTSDNRTALMIACSENKFSIVQLLCPPTNDPHDYLDNNGNSAVHYCSWSGSFDCLRYLIEECHFNSNLPNAEGLTPSHFASAGNHVQILEYLDQLKPSPISTSISEEFEKRNLDMDGREEGEEDSGGRGFDDISHSGLTTFHRAILHQSEDTVEYLLSKERERGEYKDVGFSSSLLFQLTHSGSSPLHLSCQQGSFPLFSLLVLEYERLSLLDPPTSSFSSSSSSSSLSHPLNQLNDYGLSPLMFAASGGHSHLCRLLLLISSYSYLPPSLSPSLPRPPLSTLLSSSPSSSSSSSISTSSSSSHSFLSILERFSPSHPHPFLISSSPSNPTPLHLVAASSSSSSSSIEMAQLFVSCGAHIFEKDREGQTAIDIALTSGHKPLASKLALFSYLQHYQCEIDAKLPPISTI